MDGKETLMKTCFFIFCLAFAGILNPLFGANWDTEYWQYLTVKNWKSGPYQLSTSGEMRLHQDVSNVYHYRISEYFAYQALPNLDLEVHYSYIYNKPKGAMRFNHTSRLEFEINPSLSFSNGITFKWRNRLELLKKHGVSHIEFVGRHRTLLFLTVRNCGFLSSIQAYDEIHYDFKTSRITQNRFVPIELSYVFKDTVALDLFVMLRHFYIFSLVRWSRSIVLGTEIAF